MLGELGLGFDQAIIWFKALGLNVWNWVCRMGIAGVNMGKGMEGRCVCAVPVVSLSSVLQTGW